jgi:hypothetical protein
VSDRANEDRHVRYWSWLARPVCLLPLIILVTSCGPKPAEETVTVRSSQHQTVSAEAPRVSTAQLPPRNPDIEKAGDLIAEATLHLHQRNSVAALHAVSRAEVEVKGVLGKTPANQVTHGELVSTLRELESVTGLIHRGMFTDAIRRLGELNRKLDSLD